MMCPAHSREKGEWRGGGPHFPSPFPRHRTFLLCRSEYKTEISANLEPIYLTLGAGRHVAIHILRLVPQQKQNRIPQVHRILSLNQKGRVLRRDSRKSPSCAYSSPAQHSSAHWSAWKIASHFLDNVADFKCFHHRV